MEERERIVFHWTKVRAPASNLPFFPDFRRANFFDFRCAIVGDVVYVCGGHKPNSTTPFPAHTLFTFNVNSYQWRKLRVHGDTPATILGNPIVLVDDELLNVGACSSRRALMDDIHSFDLVLREWKSYKLAGALMCPGGYHVADLWKEKQYVLINCMEDAQDMPFNRTYILCVDSWHVQAVQAKGMPPRRRKKHSSCLVCSDNSTRWFICGGEVKRFGGIVLWRDLHILEFKPHAMPRWSSPGELTGLDGIRKASLLVVRDQLLILGGFKVPVADTAMSTYDLQTKELRQGGAVSEGEAPELRHLECHQTVRVDQHLYLLPFVDRPVHFKADIEVKNVE